MRRLFGGRQQQDDHSSPTAQRGDLFSLEELAAHARSLAAHHHVWLHTRGDPLLARLQANEQW